MTHLYWLHAFIQIYSSLNEHANHACIKKEKALNWINQIREILLIFALKIKVMVHFEVNLIHWFTRIKAKVKSYLKVERQSINFDIPRFDSARHDVLDLTPAKALIDLKIVKTVLQPSENFPEVIPDLPFFSSKNTKSVSQYYFTQAIPLTDDGMACMESSSVIQNEGKA